MELDCPLLNSGIYWILDVSVFVSDFEWYRQSSHFQKYFMCFTTREYEYKLYTSHWNVCTKMTYILMYINPDILAYIYMHMLLYIPLYIYSVSYQWTTHHEDVRGVDVYIHVYLTTALIEAQEVVFSVMMTRWCKIPASFRLHAESYSVQVFMFVVIKKLFRLQQE